MDVLIWIFYVTAIVLIAFAVWIARPLSPAELQRTRERDIELTKQQDIAAINDAYKEAIAAINDAAGQSWRNITQW